MSPIFVLVALLVSVRATTDPEHLEDTVRLLKGQVQALLEQKEQESQLAQELKSLREEVAEAKSNSKRGHNVETRIGWLEASMAEARGQLGELGAAIARERSAANSVSQLRAQLDRQANEIRALRANIQTLHAKLLASQEQHLENGHKDSFSHRSSGYASGEKRTRHHRGLRGEVESIMEEQSRQTSSLGSLVVRVRNLEAEANATSSRLRAPVLELLETVQGLETRIDKALPGIQREVSRTELSLAQVMQQSALLKENQDNQRATLKALTQSVSNMQDKLAGKHLNQIQHSTSLKNGSSAMTTLLANLTKVISDYEDVINHLPHDCSDVVGNGETLIRPGGRGKPILADCHEGWTVIQRRVDGSQEFNKNWEEYAKGFGAPTGELWMGNEALHRLTEDNTTSLRVDLVDIYGTAWLAEYSSFHVGPREDGFRLSVSGYSGNASDALDYQNGMQFSTADSDRDASNTHCAANYEGGWWYSHCEHANLNGRYNLGLTWFHATNNEWIAVDKSVMKIKNHHNSV